MAFNSYEFRLLRAKRHADKVKQDQIVKEIWHRNDANSDKRAISFSKIAIIFICLNGLAIEFYSMWIMYEFHDISHLSSLIGILGSLIAQSVSIAGYFSKSKAENTSGGIVFQNMQNEFRQGILDANASVISSPTNTMATDDEDAVG